MRPRRDCRGRRSARPSRLPRPEQRHEARDRVPRPTANRVRSAAAIPDVQACSWAGALRMTQHHPPVKRGHAAIAGRLVEHRVTLYRIGKRLCVAFLLYLKRVESRALHEQELVAQHLAGGAQLAAIAVAFPQQPCLTVGATVAEGRKRQSDNREPFDMGDEIVDVAIVRPVYAGSSDAARQRLRILEKSRCRNQDRAIARNRSIVRDVDERIARYFSASNEWHKPAP